VPFFIQGDDMSIALIVWLAGGLLYVFQPNVGKMRWDRFGELCRWAFIVGLAAWLFLLGTVVVGKGIV
jgi:hypothetical protein